LELLTLEAGREISSWPSPSLSSSAGSEWFEDWPEANDMVASVYVLLTAETSCTRQEQEDASRQSPGRSCSCVPKVDSASGDQRPSHRGAVGRKPHAGGSVGGDDAIVHSHQRELATGGLQGTTRRAKNRTSRRNRWPPTTSRHLRWPMNCF
jgi:hypothetical protein